MNRKILEQKAKTHIETTYKEHNYDKNNQHIIQLMCDFFEKQGQTLPIDDVSNYSEKELPYLDKNGKEIKEFAVLKVYHFLGVNEQGRGRKHYYMYKWVRLIESKGKLYWVAFHLNDTNISSWYSLRAVADKKTRIISESEIVQQY